MKYFEIHEFVPPEVYAERKEKSIELIDSRILFMADLLREQFGPATINNWYWGGNREWSGLRTSDSPYYSKYSQHTFGRAVDMLFKNAVAETVRQRILEMPGMYIGINAIEMGVSWVHIDCRNCNRIMRFWG